MSILKCEKLKKYYGKDESLVKALDDMINNISIVIEEAPTIVLMAKMVLPKKMKDIKNISTRMTRDGYNLEYLNILDTLLLLSYRFSRNLSNLFLLVK